MLDRKKALILSIAITLLIATDIHLFKILTSEKLETVLVSRVIDGDTIELEDGRKIRLLNINSPEKNVPLSNLSFIYLKKIENKKINIQSIGKGKYGRTLARLHTSTYLNLEMVEEGLSSKFLVDKSEHKEYDKAESEAVKKQKGIWKHSPYFGCFSLEIDKKKEILLISSSCGEISFKDWKLKDESTKIFSFPNIRSQRLKVHTFEGKNNQTDIFWNSKRNIWNDDSDTVYLFDSSWQIASHKSYGY